MSKKLYAALVAGTAVLALGATGAQAATTNGTATANIVSAITITQNTGLNFGTIVPAASASTVAIDLANARTCGAGLTCSGTATSGAFTATGTANQAVSVTTAASTTLSNGTDSMSVASIAPSVASATLSAGGTANFTVAGTLTVGASQAAGVYTGTYAVNVNYN